MGSIFLPVIQLKQQLPNIDELLEVAATATNTFTPEDYLEQMVLFAETGDWDLFCPSSRSFVECWPPGQMPAWAKKALGVLMNAFIPVEPVEGL